MSPEGIKYSIAAFLTGVVAMIGIYFIFQPAPVPKTTPPPPQITQPTPSAPLPPEVTVEIQKIGKQSNLVIVWSNLPDGTTVLKIYRAKKGTQNWELWKTVQIDNTPQNRASGKTSIAIDNSGYTYTYYVEAVKGNSGNSSSTGNEETLWGSAPIDPTITTSTTPTTPPSTPSPTSTPPQTPTPTSTTSSTPATQPSSTQGTNPASSTPTNNSYWYYYKPQGGLSGTSTPRTDNFWVQHIDNKIEIGWQNLPSSTNKFIVYRSQNDIGPWTTILTQQNPVLVGPSSLQIVDETLGTSYYYFMSVFHSSTLIESYGPLYLPAL